MLSNSPRYQINALNAAKEIARGAKQHRIRAVRTMRNERLQGCNCHLAGYVRKTLRGARGLSGLSAPEVVSVPALIPVSDRTAIMNAVKVFKKGRTVAGIGNVAQTQSAASMAATGAKMGSMIFPGIGTIIGAFVGAIAGWLMGASKPVRASADQIAQCKTLLAEYSSMAAQSPNECLPMTLPQLQQINWCLNAVYGADIKLRDPRYFDGNLVDLMTMAKGVVKGIYETPVGNPVNIEATSNVVRGVNIQSAGFSFNNPTFTDLKTFNDQYFQRFAIKYCENAAKNNGGGCPTLYGRSEYKRLLYDLLGYAARETLPNISEADFRAASQIAATTGNSAKDVVSVVENILGRSVQRNETAALLNPSGSGGAPSLPPAAIIPLLPTPAAPVIPLSPLATPTTPLPSTPNNPMNLPSVSSGGGTTLLPAQPSDTAPAQPVQPVQPQTAGGVAGMPMWLMLLMGGFAFAVIKPTKGKRK